MDKEKNILNPYFGSLDLVIHGGDEVDNSIVINTLSQSNKIYCIDSENILRVYQQGMNNIQTMRILEAYNLYGADAVTEAIDKGSFKVN